MLNGGRNAAQRPNLFRRRPVILLQPLLNSWAAIIAAGDLPLLLSDTGRRGK
jgi:hypothetical protein